MEHSWDLYTIIKREYSVPVWHVRKDTWCITLEKVLNLPPYNLNLLPCNDLVFYPLKKALRGLWFGSGIDIKVTMVQCSLQWPMEFFWKGSTGWCVNEATSLVPMGITFNRLYSFAEISPHTVLIWTYLMSACEVVEVLGETGVTWVLDTDWLNGLDLPMSQSLLLSIAQ